MSKFRSFLVFLCSAFISGFIFFLIGAPQENTTAVYQQLLWEFTYQQKFTALNEAAEEVCQLKDAIHDNVNNKNLPQIEHALLLHSEHYTLLADDYSEHLQNGLYAHLIKEDDNRVLTLQEIKRMACN